MTSSWEQVQCSNCEWFCCCCFSESDLFSESVELVHKTSLYIQFSSLANWLNDLSQQWIANWKGRFSENNNSNFGLFVAQSYYMASDDSEYIVCIPMIDLFDKRPEFKSLFNTSSWQKVRCPNVDWIFKSGLSNKSVWSRLQEKKSYKYLFRILSFMLDGRQNVFTGLLLARVSKQFSVLCELIL